MGLVGVILLASTLKNVPASTFYKPPTFSLKVIQASSAIVLVAASIAHITLGTQLYGEPATIVLSVPYALSLWITAVYNILKLPDPSSMSGP